MTCHRRDPSPTATRPPARLVVFDFDGTLSWLRHGWPRIMTAVMRAHLPARSGEDEAAVAALLAGIVLGMNGHPTIMQMTRFAALVRERGGPVHAPEALRAEYQARLDAEIAARVARMRDGSAGTDAFVVCGARRLLERLAASGAVLAVLSSTVEERVREEAGVLGLTGYFAGRIHGLSLIHI